MQIRMLQLSKEKYFSFQYVHLILVYPFFTQNEEKCYKVCRLL